MTGKQLATILKQNKLSVSEYSKMINVNETSLKEYLKQDFPIRNDIVVSTCRLLNLDLCDQGMITKIISRRESEIDVEFLEEITKTLGI